MALPIKQRLSIALLLVFCITVAVCIWWVAWLASPTGRVLDEVGEVPSPGKEIGDDDTGVSSRLVDADIPEDIRRLDGDHVEEILSLIELDKPALTRAAARCLSQTRNDPRVLGPLLDLFENQPALLMGFESDLFRRLYQSQGAEALVAILKVKQYSARTRRWAFVAMENDPHEPEMAILALADRDSDLRHFAALRLSALQPPNMTDRVFDILDQLDGHPYLVTLRPLAAYLGSTKDPRAAIPLVEGLLYTAEGASGYLEPKPSQVKALGELNDPRAIDPLLAKVNDPNRNVRLAAIHGLKQIDHPRVEDIFRKGVDGPNAVLPADLDALLSEIERKEQSWTKP